MRSWSAAVGAASAFLLWIGPGAVLAEAGFAGHMVRHIALVTVVPALLAAAVTGGPFDPVTRAPRLFAPIPASFVELAVVWLWHAPLLHHLARDGGWALGLEQASFLVSGLWVWLAALGGGATAGRDDGRAAAGVVGLLLTSMHMTLLGALLALAPRPLYAAGSGPGSLERLADQQLGGALMILVGGLFYLGGGLWLSSVLVRRRGRRPAEERR